MHIPPSQINSTLAAVNLGPSQKPPIPHPTWSLPSSPSRTQASDSRQHQSRRIPQPHSHDTLIDRTLHAHDSRPWLLPSMTRGRRKDLTIPPSRALLQQRDYRARKAQYVSDLEDRVRKAEEDNSKLRKEIDSLRLRAAASGSMGPSAEVVS